MWFLLSYMITSYTFQPQCKIAWAELALAYYQKELILPLNCDLGDMWPSAHRQHIMGAGVVMSEDVITLNAATFPHVTAPNAAMQMDQAAATATAQVSEGPICKPAPRGPLPWAA